MSARKLQIARGLRLDPDYVGGGTFALLAKKGAGKTYAMRVMAEEFSAVKVPFVALDPMDAFWGLKSSADGDSAGLPIPIFGGPHGDAPLERTGGKLMADLVVDEGLSMVLSTKHFGSRSAERQFAMDFLERLYRRNEDLVHVLIDEADLFAPQKPRREDQQLLVTTENIVRRGRNNGIGVTMATQRPAVLNKDVLNQVDGLIVMRMLGPNDRNSIDDWVGEHGDTGQGGEVKNTLPNLGTGEAWFWVPELGVLERAKVRPANTFDSSPTRKRGQRKREPKGFADVDMAAIEKRMADTIERAKAEDPKELRKRIRELEKELSERPSEQVEVEKVVEVPVLANGAMEKLEGQVASIHAAGSQLEGLAAGLRQELARVAGDGRTRDVAQRQPRARRRGSDPLSEAAVARADTPRRPVTPPSAEADDAEVKLKAGARRMLQALARLHPEPLTRVQVGTLADITPKSGTFSDYLSTLKRGGLVIEEHGKLELTDRGVEEMADELGAGAPSARELQEMWGRKLKAGARRMLDALMDAPDGLTRAELAEASEITAGSGTFSDYLSSLRRNTLAEERSGVVYAGEALFLGERTRS